MDQNKHHCYYTPIHELDKLMGCNYFSKECDSVFVNNSKVTFNSCLNLYFDFKDVDSWKEFR